MQEQRLKKDKNFFSESKRGKFPSKRNRIRKESNIRRK